VSDIANHITVRSAKAIVHNTQDYAAHSPFLKQYLSRVQAIQPPIEMAPAMPDDMSAFKTKANIQPGQRIIGIAARLATEKGVEYLAQAMPIVLQKHPTARVLFVGPYQDIVGEEAYARRLAPLLDLLGNHWTFLGVLDNGEFAAFFQQCEVTVLPSINSTESYGMVQVESMQCGTPVIASDRPGMRVPVQMTGMGNLFPPGDVQALAQALIDFLDHPEVYRGDPQTWLEASTTQAVAARYEALFESLNLPATQAQGTISEKT
jgi:glycosyltransferase involved in cell wall biosynthesis